MTAKEKQEILIKTYLKPLLKDKGYKTSGNNWWKNNETFYSVINLQNFSFNSKDQVDFCFNIGIALERFISDKTKKKITGYDIAIPCREQCFISKSRQEHKFRKNLGFRLETDTNMEDFTTEFRIDFEQNILPTLESLNSIDKCVEFYDKMPLWKNTFRQLVEKNK
ncbi:DUF4304 domain-containing protein [Flavobacterium sp.]|uniref:DUF4304 domain-containing protein n=1 Tax=Flavobacterium sp. TaxID=239 RepID=UPI0031E2DC66